ncbi:hypothetical protein D3C76_1127070 [compost metagenome]
MPDEAIAGFLQPAFKADRARRQPSANDHAVRLQEIADRNQRAGGHRQLLFHMGKLLDHLRHHRYQQNTDDRNGYHRQGDRVDHRLGELTFHLLALFVVLRQLLQYIAEVAGFFSGHHQGAVELVEGAGKLAEGVEQRMPFHHLVANVTHHRRQLFILRLPGNGFQGALQRQRGVHQRRQLAGKHRQVRR